MGTHRRSGGGRSSRVGDGRGGRPDCQGHRGRVTATTVVGEVILTVGLLLLSYVFYESYWTNIRSGQLQHQADEQLEQAWSQQGPGQYINPRTREAPELGAAFARLYVPAFGSDFRFAVMEGTDDGTLLTGPGHYVDTQLPGQPGNFAVAGHRVGKGAPFNDLGQLHTCDAIVVETAVAWNVYRVLPVDGDMEDKAGAAAGCMTPELANQVSTGAYAQVTGRSITLPSDVGVISPVPGGDAVLPVAAGQEGGLLPLLTLTTCHPQFSAAERMIIHAVLVRSESKTPGTTPVELQEA